MPRFRKAPLPIAVFLSLLTATARAQVPSPPVFENIQVHANCAYDAATQTFRYEYNVTNPATNTIRIWTIILVVGNTADFMTAITEPPGWFSHVKF